MLRVDNVTVAYGLSTAVREVSLVVNNGEIVTIVGSNGAGKTSLLNAISGTVRVKSGTIWLDEVRISGRPPHKTVRLGVGYVPEGRQIFGSMSVMDNLIMGSYPLYTRKWLRNLGLCALGAARQPGQAQPGEGAQALPQARRAAQTAGGQLERRRATDAGHRAGAHVISQDTAAG